MQALAMGPLDLVKLPALMRRTRGDCRVRVAVVDGPVEVEDPSLAGARLSEIPGHRGICEFAGSTACLHGTFVAGILSARRGSGAPAMQFERDFSLSGVTARPSVLSSTRRIVDVIFSFTNRATYFTEKFVVSCDVTHTSPFLVTKLSPYYDH
jgi:hypothetical protein